MKELSNIISQYKWCFAHICFNLIGERTRTSYYHLIELHLTFNAIKNQLFPRQWKFYDKKISIWEMNYFTLKFKFWTGFERNCRGNYNWLSVKWIHHHHTAADTLIFEAFLWLCSEKILKTIKKGKEKISLWRWCSYKKNEL